MSGWGIVGHKMTDDDLLADLDLSQFKEAERELIEANLYSQWEERLGDQLAKIVSDDKFAEFEMVIDQDDEDKMDEWLSANVPGYEDLAAKLLEDIKQQVRGNPEAFLAAGGQRPGG